MVVNFWYSTCAPCAKELPDFATVDAEVDDVRFVGVNTRSTRSRRWSGSPPTAVSAYELLRDHHAELVDGIEAVAFPITLFVTSDGTIVEQTGPIDADELRVKVAELRAVGAAAVSLSFIRGLVAAVNPCGFILLPTYLMFFLGLEGQRPGTQRATLRRAVLVSAALSAGFMAVFFVAGVVSYNFTNWINENSKYASVVIGAALLVLGVAMLFGYKLPFTTPDIRTSASTKRTVSAMFVFGIAYAVASIGCTIGLFIATVFSALGTRRGGDRRQQHASPTAPEWPWWSVRSPSPSRSPTPGCSRSCGRPCSTSTRSPPSS